MSKADVIEVEGVVVEKLPNAFFNYNQWKASYEFHQNFTGR